MSDESLDDCGCCEGISRETPVETVNRAGQSRIAYRVGTHARFKQSMLAALTGKPPLDGLKTRADDDSVDRAARRRRDRARRALLLQRAHRERRVPAHRDRAPLGARARARDRLRAEPRRRRQHVPRVHHGGGRRRAGRARPSPIGTKAQSIPAQDEKPQTFETVEAVEARPIWNRMRPRLTQPHAVQGGDTSIYLAGTDANLKAGRRAVFVGDERKNDRLSDVYDVRRVTAIDVQPKVGARRSCRWSPALTHGPLANGEGLRDAHARRGVRPQRTAVARAAGRAAHRRA